jgi:uncharacterized protein
MTRRELLATIAAVALVSFRSGERRTVEQRISIVTLGVRDLAASKRFYAAGFGWKPAFENNEIIFFQTGGMAFALFLRDKLAKDFHADPATFGRSACALAYNVRSKTEVDPIIQQAIAAGATLLKSAREATWGGYSGYFADPDGFAWEIAWNPGWPIKPDGSVEFR